MSVASVTVTVTDDQTPGLTVDPLTLALTEQDASAESGTYTVALAAQPSGVVRLTATSGDTAVEIDTDATPLTRTLTYSATTWNTAQTVTVRAGQDDDAVDDTVTWTHDPSGSDYNNVANVELMFTAGNWATARTVAPGDTDGNDERVTLTHTAAGADYPTSPAVTDDDVPGCG